MIVSDGIVDSEPATVLVQVKPPVEANLFMVPKTINTNSEGKNILAIFTLTDGIQIEDIDTDFGFTLYPPDASSILYRATDKNDSTRIFILFDREQVTSTLSEKTIQELTVVTKLKTGQYLFAADTVRIVESHKKTRQNRTKLRRNTPVNRTKRP